MNRRHRTRRHARPALLWRTTYGNRARVGVGIILDMHETVCRIAGCMPKKTGSLMRSLGFFVKRERQ
jgi:hypothetical protein